MLVLHEFRMCIKASFCYFLLFLCFNFFFVLKLNLSNIEYSTTFFYSSHAGFAQFVSGTYFLHTAFFSECSLSVIVKWIAKNFCVEVLLID